MSSLDAGKNSKGTKPAAVSLRRRKSGKRILRNYELYLFLLPAVLITFIFSYIPMYGLLIAFKDYQPTTGIFASRWNGFAHFTRFFNSYQFKPLIRNTIYLSLYSMIAGFPFPILIALILNQLLNRRYQRVIQTVIYMPHFISLVVMVGMLNLFLSPNTGLYGLFMRFLGRNAQNIIGKPEAFRHIYVWSDIWQHAGWDSIIYIAALSAVDPTLYEAARIDGASRFRRMLHIDVPTIIPTIVVLLILRAGSIMTVGFEKALLMQNQMNASTSEIISTYVYKVGIQNLQYGYSAAVGLFNNAINFAILIIVNAISKRASDTGLW